MKENNNLRKSILVLMFAICFAAFGFTSENGNAQTKGAKKTPTPSKSKKPEASSKKETSSKSSKNDSKTAKTAKNADKSKSSKEKNASAKDKKSTDKKSAKKSDETKSKASATAKNSKSSNNSSSTKEKNVASKKPAEKKSNIKTERSVKPTVEKPIETAKINYSKTSKSENAPQIIVSVTSARVRTDPALSAATVAFAKLGSLYPVLEQTERWYKVRLTDSDKIGWISMEVADGFDKTRREAIYENLLKKYYKEDDKDFHTSAEVFEFLTRARDEATDEKQKADLCYKRYVALRSALKAIPAGKSEENPYKDFLKAHDEEIVYSEPSAEWLVRANLLWELHGSYQKLPIGEEIAWQAANNPIPGECEGYTNCYIYLIRVTDGEYLNFYPNGKYAERALKHMTDFLEPIAADAENKKVYSAPADTSDRADFNQLLTELRNIISKLPYVEKSKTIQQINKIAEGYR